MKKISILIIVMLLYSGLLSSQVSVNPDGTPPHNSAMLDVGSSEKGVLLPRMTMADLEAILNPAKGLMVYCTNDNNFFVNRGTELTPDWTMVNSKWRANGPNIYYLAGNVGIGWDAPIMKLDIRSNTPDESATCVIGNSNLSHRLIISGGWQSNPDPFIQWKEGDALRFSTDEGGGIERMRITSIGQVGIGTPLPAANFHVTETPSAYTGIFGTPVSTWNFGTNVSIGDDNQSSVLYIGQGSDSKGYLIWHYDETPTNAYLSVGTYGDESPLILQEAGGKIGIGTTDPSYLLDIHHDDNSYTAFGHSNKHCEYIFHLEDAADGDGQTALFAERFTNSGNSGTGYQPYAINSAIKGSVYSDSNTDEYSFALAGYNPNDDDRCGGVIGSRYDGYVWGSLGYRNSSGSHYGGYFTSSEDGTGKSGATPSSGIGIGAWGDLMGADIHGKVYGIYAAGENYASFLNGAVFKNNLDVHLQENGSGTHTVLYTYVSTDVCVQTCGVATLSNGKASIVFDAAFTASASSEIPVIVTVTPTGKSGGVYLSDVSRNGFTVVENNDGMSNVNINYIAIGRRTGYENPSLPPEVIDAGYTDKMARGLHNDADKQTNGKGLYYENGELVVGIHPSSLPDPNKPAGSTVIPKATKPPERVLTDGEKELIGD